MCPREQRQLRLGSLLLLAMLPLLQAVAKAGMGGDGILDNGYGLYFFSRILGQVSFDKPLWADTMRYLCIFSQIRTMR